MWLCESVVTLKVVGKKEGDYHRSLNQKRTIATVHIWYILFFSYINHRLLLIFV